MRSQRKVWNEVELSQKGALGGLGYPAHLLGPLAQPGTPWRAAGQCWPSQHWPIDPIKKNKKIKEPFPLPELRDKSGKCFKSNCSRSVQSIKVQSRSMSSLHTQFGGDKIRNHVLYLTPLIALEKSDKEGAAVDTIFCPLSICVSDPKKIIFSP